MQGALSVEALQSSFDEIILRHEVLRTGFVEVEGSVSVRLIPPYRIPLVCLSYDSDTGENACEKIRVLARTWFTQLRQCGPDIRELLHDGCPVACVKDAAFAYVNVYHFITRA